MKVGVIKETKDKEFRVALPPSGVVELNKANHTVYVQNNAGAGIGFSNADYTNAGAIIIDSTAELIQKSDLLVKVKEPTEEECNLLTPQKTLFTYLHLPAAKLQLDLLLKAKTTAIAYETVTSNTGSLPLLTPMSEVAGRLAILNGSQFLLKHNNGKGVLLNGVAGVQPANVVIVGAGVVGSNALITAVGAGAKVTVLDTNLDRLRSLDALYTNRITTLYASKDNLAKSIATADLVVGAVLIPGASAPKLITKDMLALMQKGTVIVDVAIDQGGFAETSKPTTYSNPVYEIEGVIHYCVANMPAAVAKTSSQALSNATLPFIMQLANLGVKQALLNNNHLLNGLNVANGKITHSALSTSFNMPYYNAVDVIKEIN